jgi:SulP family sulfate permease
VGAIPLAALAGVLMVTAARMVHVAVRAVLRSTRADAVAFIATAVITVSFDLIVAVGIGVVFAGIVALRGLARASVVRREPLARAASRATSASRSCASRAALLRRRRPRARGSRPSPTSTSSSSHEPGGTRGCHRRRTLGEIVQSLERRGITVLIKGVQPRHEDLFRTVGVLAALRHHNHLFDDDLPPRSRTPAATCADKRATA